jgi:hypothetical protein
VILLSFEAALSHLKEGGKVTRDIWNNSPKYIFIHRGYKKIQSMSINGRVCSFELYAKDLLAEDWTIVLEEGDNGYKEIGGVLC